MRLQKRPFPTLPPPGIVIYNMCASPLRLLRRILLGFAIVTVAHVSPCASQELRAVSVEFNLGAGFGGSSALHGPSGGASADALLGYRPGARGSGSFVVGMSASGQAFGISHACDVLPGGNCIPEFPEFWIFSALAGWETANGGARFLVGPAVATSSSELVGAAQARVDLAKPIFSHLSLLASARFGYIPKYRDESFRLASVGIGFRLR